MKPDKIIIFINEVAAKYANTKSKEGKEALIDALFIYDRNFLNGFKYVYQHAYFKKKVIELNPLYEQVFQLMETKYKSQRKKTMAPSKSDQ